MNTKTKIYIGLAVGATALIGGTIAYVKIKKKVNLNKDIKSTNTGNIPALGINTYTIAKQIGLDLGIAYPSYDPRSWTENDEEVVKSVLKVPKTLIKKLTTDYASIYKRNLQADLQKLVGNYNEIAYLFI